MRCVSTVLVCLVVCPAIYLGAWGSRLPLGGKIGLTAIALTGTLAAIPLADLAAEELGERRARRESRRQIRAAKYAASTQQAIGAIREAFGVGQLPGWQRDLVRDIRNHEAFVASILSQTQTPTELVDAPSPTPRYDLTSLPKERKHLLICGDTGSGKSTLVKLVVSLFAGARVRVYDCDATDRDWIGYPVIGRGDDFAAIAGAMAEDLTTFEARAGMNTDAVTDVIVAEEYPAIAEEVPAARDWLKKLARRGRKRGFRVILVTQDIQVDTLGLRNQSKVLTNFNQLFLGGYAFTKLGEIKDRVERATIGGYLQQQPRPCLAEVNGRFYPCDVPDLAGFRGEPVNVHQAQANPPRTRHANPLEPLLSLGSGTHEPCEPAQTFDPLNPEILPEERGTVVSLKRSGLTQDPIIKKVWGSSKGGGPSYLAARAKYRQIIADAGMK